MLGTSRALTARAMRVALVCTEQRMRVIAEREENPFGVATKAFGSATARAELVEPDWRTSRDAPARTSMWHGEARSLPSGNA
jgi:hypothetical protein